MKNLMAVVATLWMPAACLAQANDLEVMGLGADLHGAVEAAWQSKYVWRGFDIYADTSAAQLTANLDLFGTGFGVNVAGHRANSSGFENGERWDYTLYYGDVLYAGEPLATRYRVGFVHYNYPQLASSVRDIEEMHAILSWPSMTGVKGLVPSYVIVGAWPAHSGASMGGSAAGFLQIARLDYSVSVPGPFPDTPEQILKLHAEIVFNDGWHPAGVSADHDWSNAVFGISTDIDLGFGFTLAPSAYYQISMEESVNTEDEAWLAIGAVYAF